MTMDIKGKVAVVTGAASGIGHAVCLELMGRGIKTDEEYASVPPEINDKVINVIREMRAAGTPMPEIMRHAREIIEAYIDSYNKTL